MARLAIAAKKDDLQRVTTIRSRSVMWQRRVGSAAKHAVLLSFCGLFLLPWLWLISTSLKGPRQVLTWPPVWIPNPVVVGNYVTAFTRENLAMYITNTLVICVVTVTGAVLSNTMIAYGFSRIRWPGRDALFILVLATMMLPFQVTMIPLYVMFSQMGWVNTFLPLTVPSLFGGAFFIFLLRQFFMTIPEDFSDAGRIDGANESGLLRYVILPMAKPALAVVALFQFIWSWNDFLGPLIYINDKAKFTLSLGLAHMRHAFGLSQFAVLMAASTISVLPLVVLFFFMQRTFIEGITMTGLKG
jgi:multiple sugar transport system permease protein